MPGTNAVAYLSDKSATKRERKVFVTLKLGSIRMRRAQPHLILMFNLYIIFHLTLRSRHDTRHYDTRHNDAWHNDLTSQFNFLNVMLSVIMSLCSVSSY